MTENIPGIPEAPTFEHEFKGAIYVLTEAHPEAVRYGWLEDDDLQTLANNIAAEGLDEPVLLLPDGRIVDGRNRELACKVAGVYPTYATKFLAEADIPGFVERRNLHRRHLSPERRRELIAEKLRDNPGQSNRAVAAVLKVSAHTVADVRNELEVKEEIPKQSVTVGRDNKKRTTKPARAVKPTSGPEPTARGAQLTDTGAAPGNVQLEQAEAAPVEPHRFEVLAGKVKQLTAEITSALRCDDDDAAKLRDYFGIAGAVKWKKTDQSDDEAVAEPGTGGEWVPVFVQLNGFAYLLKLATEPRKVDRRAVEYQFGVRCGGILSRYAQRRASERMRKRKSQ